MGKLVLKFALVVATAALWTGLAGFAAGVFVGAVSVATKVESRVAQLEQDLFREQVARETLNQRLATLEPVFRRTTAYSDRNSVSNTNR